MLWLLADIYLGFCLMCNYLWLPPLLEDNKLIRELLLLLELLELSLTTFIFLIRILPYDEVVVGLGCSLRAYPCLMIC